MQERKGIFGVISDNGWGWHGQGEFLIRFLPNVLGLHGECPKTP